LDVVGPLLISEQDRECVLRGRVAEPLKSDPALMGFLEGLATTDNLNHRFTVCKTKAAAASIRAQFETLLSRFQESSSAVGSATGACSFIGLLGEPAELASLAAFAGLTQRQAFDRIKKSLPVLRDEADSTRPDDAAALLSSALFWHESMVTALAGCADLSGDLRSLASLSRASLSEADRALAALESTPSFERASLEVESMRSLVADIREVQASPRVQRSLEVLGLGGDAAIEQASKVISGARSLAMAMSGVVEAIERSKRASNRAKPAAQGRAPEPPPASAVPVTSIEEELRKRFEAMHRGPAKNAADDNVSDDSENSWDD